MTWKEYATEVHNMQLAIKDDVKNNCQYHCHIAKAGTLFFSSS